MIKLIASGAVLAYGGVPGAREMTRDEIAAAVGVAHAAGIPVTAHGKDHLMEIDIQPGLVSTFTFRGFSGFVNQPPPLPGSDFEPLLTP